MGKNKIWSRKDHTQFRDLLKSAERKERLKFMDKKLKTAP